MYFADTENGPIAMESFDGEAVLLDTEILIDTSNLMFESAMNQLESLPYYEEEEEEDSKDSKKKSKKDPNKDSLIDKLKAAIKAVIDKIKTLLGKNKEHLTPEDFINSETGQAMISEEFAKRCAIVDREMAQLRPLVAKMSKWTDKDILEVEKICNRIDACAHEKAPVAGALAGAIVKSNAKGAVAKQASDCLNRIIPGLNKYTELLEQQAMLDTDNPKRLKAQKRLVDTLGRSSAYFASYKAKYKKQNLKGKVKMTGKTLADSAKTAVKDTVSSTLDIKQGVKKGLLGR